MKYITRVAILFSFCFLVCGCGPTRSVHPAGELKKAIRDPELAGVWRLEDSNQYLHIYSCAEDGQMDIAMIGEHDSVKNVGAQLTLLNAYVSEVGNDRVINFKITGALDNEDQEKPPKDFFFFRYILSEGKLTTWSLDDDALTAAIKTSQIKGDFKNNKFERLTDTSENIQKFILAHKDKEIWSKDATFERIAKPSIKK